MGLRREGIYIKNNFLFRKMTSYCKKMTNYCIVVELSE